MPWQPPPPIAKMGTGEHLTPAIEVTDYEEPLVDDPSSWPLWRRMVATLALGLLALMGAGVAWVLAKLLAVLER